MGGSKFANSNGSNESLKFPRLPNAIYWSALAQAQRKLSSLFKHVASPPPAPQKRDHGDLDLVVALPRDNTRQPKPQTVAELLCAVRCDGGPGRSWNFAVPLRAMYPLDIDKVVLEHADALDEIHVQIDVNVCGSEEQFHWRLFKHSYGDLWQMLGKMIRPFGLVADENALCLRVEEMEELGAPKDEAKIRLTSDPLNVMSFLGLDAILFEQGFRTELEVFNFVVTCRLFSTKTFVNRRSARELEGARRNILDMSKNDRQRARKRDMFNRFLEWTERNFEDLSFFDTPLTRRDVVCDAVAQYGIGTKLEKKTKETRRRAVEEELRRTMSDNLSSKFPARQIRSRVMRGFEIHVFFNEDLRLPVMKTCGYSKGEGFQAAGDERLSRSDRKVWWSEWPMATDDLLNWFEVHALEVLELENERAQRMSTGHVG